MMKKIFSFSFLTAMLLIVGSCKKDSDSEKDSALEFDFAQPAAFAAGETKEIPYTAVGNIADIRFLDIPNGWSLTANRDESKLRVTAPATFDNSNRAGEATILVSDNLQHTVVRTIILTAKDGNEDGDDDDDVTDATAVTVEGYSGNSIAVYYTDDTYGNITKNAAGIFAVPRSSKVIHHIDLDEYTIFVGRRADGSAIPLKLRNGNLILRDAVDGFIPIGTYSEFQLIDDSRTSLAGSYKQETDLDLLDLEWTPTGNIVSYFTGTFDGDGHTVANLKITGEDSGVGLFGYISNANLLNIHIISGSVSGSGGICGSATSSSITDCYNAGSVSGSGGICGYAASTSITNCHNTGSVSGNSFVGGVCGYTLSSPISNCSNTGSVSGNSFVGGVCGYTLSSSPIIACYNTGSVSGSGDCVGGVCGYTLSSSSITACYNTGSVSGTNNVGGVCGSFSSSSIIACYNTGSVSGSGDYVGGVCGYISSSSSSSFSIIACYNTGSVSGSSDVGGVCGYAISLSSSSITACYNTGSVSGSSDVGGICGYYPSSLSLSACYWKDIPNDDANYGIGHYTSYPNLPSNEGTSIFGAAAWPTTATHTQWGIGDGSGDGKYWKSLGSWNGENPEYPKLYFE